MMPALAGGPVVPLPAEGAEEPMPNDSPRPLRTGAPDFDPVARAFLAQDRRPAGLTAVAAGDLSPLQRALLVIDGTVTTFLAAWALEPVTVQPLEQLAVPARDVAGLPGAPWLGLTSAGTVIRRAVLLRGAHSQRLFAFAESLICADRLPAALRAGLDSGGLSIGQLLLLPGFESRREGLWYGRERGVVLPAPVAAAGPPDFLTRTYRVSAGAEPLMLITERFPWTLRA